MARHLLFIRCALIIALFIAAIPNTKAQIVTSGAGSGDWNDPLSWTPNGIPSSASPSITINHPITVTAAANGDQMIINSGGSLTINSGITFMVAAGSGDDLTINSGGIVNILDAATLQIQNQAAPPPPKVALIRVYGRLNNAGTISNASSSRLFFEAGSIYDHQYTSSAGLIPPASWNSTSTCQVSGYTSNNVAPTGLGQSFGNFIWDTPSLVSFLDLNGGLTTVTGNLTIRNVPSSYVYLTSTSDYTLDVGGDFNISNSFFGLNSTANATININGNVLFSNNNDLNPTFDGNTTINANGNFEISGGTTNLTYNGAGSIPLNVKGDFTLSSSPTINNGGTGTYILTFNGSGTQVYSASQDLTDYSYLIQTGSRVDVGTGSYFSSSGSFTLQSGATLGVGGVNGITSGTSSGNIRVSGTRTYNSGSTIVYNGLAAQFMGNGEPADPGVTTILSNPNGVTVAAGVNPIIGGDLLINSGTLTLGSQTLTLEGTIGGAGTITGSSTSNLIINGTGTLGTLQFTNNPGNLNNLTLNRTSSGLVTLGGALTIGGTFTQTDGDLDFSGQSLTLNGPYSRTTGNLLSNSTSSFIIGGLSTNALPASVTFGGGLALNTLTMNRATQTLTTNAGLALTNLNLFNGTINNTGTITMATGGTVTRSGGTLSSALSAVSSYNVVYNNGSAIASGQEIPSGPILLTGLNNLTKQNSGALTIGSALTINGNLTLAGPGFDIGTQSMNLKGNFISNGSSTLTGGIVTFSGTTSITGSTTPVFGIVNILDMSSTLTPGANFQVNGNLANNGTLNTTSGTVTFGGTTTISGSQPTSFANVIINGTLTGPTAPNNQTINVSGSWTNNGTFNGGTGATGSTVNFTGTSTIAGTNPTTFNNLSITGVLTSPTTLALKGNFTNNGTFNAGTGTLMLNGTSVQNISGTTNTTFNNITVTNNANPISVQVQSNQSIKGILTLSANTKFDADGSSGTSIFTLLSTADQLVVADAAIAELPAGAEVKGNVTVQRYMSIEGGSNSPAFNNGKIYRYISSPVSAAPVSQIQTFIPVPGPFTGSSSCSGCSSDQTMFDYNEMELTDTNSSGVADLNDGYEKFPVAANTETLSPGRGYAIFVRGNIPPVSTAGNAKWEVRSPINFGTIDFVATAGVSYTVGNGIANDGWNLVGNPYPSTIDWDAPTGWTKTGLNNTIYMKDNGSASGTYATYVGGSGGTNGGTRYIPMGQAFWVKATSTPTFQATEAVKSPGSTTTFFRSSPGEDIMRVTLRKDTKRDEILIYFDANATEEFDGDLDAYKLQNDIFNLSSVTSEGTKLAINGLPMLECSKTVNLDVANISTGAYQLDFTEFESFSSPVNIILNDNFSGESKDVKTNTTYEFEVTTDESSYKDRFTLTFAKATPDPALVITSSEKGVSCNGGSVTLNAAGAPAGGGYKWYESPDDVISIAGENNAQLTTPSLTKSKTYYVSSVSASGCEGARVPVMAEVVNFDDAVIADTNNGALASNFENGNQWFKDDQLIQGATGQIYMPTESGVYKVEVTIESCKTSAERVFTVTGIEDEVSTAPMVAYPNPVNDILTVELKGTEFVNPQILDMMGRNIGEIEMKPNGNKYIGVFDFKSFPQGVYLLRVPGKDGKLLNKRISKK